MRIENLAEEQRTEAAMNDLLRFVHQAGNPYFDWLVGDVEVAFPIALTGDRTHPVPESGCRRVPAQRWKGGQDDGTNLLALRSRQASRIGREPADPMLLGAQARSWAVALVEPGHQMPSAHRQAHAHDVEGVGLRW